MLRCWFFLRVSCLIHPGVFLVVCFSRGLSLVGCALHQKWSGYDFRSDRSHMMGAKHFMEALFLCFSKRASCIIQGCVFGVPEVSRFSVSHFIKSVRRRLQKPSPHMMGAKHVMPLAAALVINLCFSKCVAGLIRACVFLCFARCIASRVHVSSNVFRWRLSEAIGHT